MFLDQMMTASSDNTGLIVRRIWLIFRETSRLKRISPNSYNSNHTSLGTAIRIFIESGLLYTSLVLITFGTEVAGSHAIYDVSNVVCVGTVSVRVCFTDNILL